MEINSKKYWDHRFSTDWITNLGRQQSTFFSRIATEAFPEWLISEIELKKPAICDWGCALGDGTCHLHERFPASTLTGIDFSAVAIQDASEHYPGIDFKCRDLLSKNGSKEFDIVFSSNTLEHFEQPWNVLSRLSTYAGQHLVILIPYKEQHRHSEHRYTFNEGNIQPSATDSFLLTHVEIINGAGYTPNYWGELQVLLIYSHTEEIKRLGLKPISSAEIRVIESLYQQKEMMNSLKEAKQQLLQLETAKSEFEIKIGDLQRTITERDELIQSQKNLLEVRQLMMIQASLEQRLAEKENTLNALTKELNETIKIAEEKKAAERILEEKLLEKEAVIRHLSEKTIETAGAHAAQQLEKDAEIEKLKNQLAEANSLHSQLATTAQECEQAFREREQALQEQINKRDSDLQALSGNLQSINAELEISNRQVQDMNQQLADAAMKKTSLEARLATGEKDIAAARKEIEKLQSELTTKDKSVIALKQELAKANDQLAHKALLEDKLAASERMMATLRKELEKANVQVGIKTLIEEQLAEREKLIEELQNSAERQDLSYKEKERALQELQQYTGKLQKDIEWYKATFEDRNVLGIIKDKAGKLLSKK